MEAVIEQLMGHQNDFEILGSWQQLAFSILVATIFGIVLMRLYSLYFQDNEPQDGSLARSMVLLAPAFTSVFWMIQNSVILSLGLLGSLSFVRFRTPVKRSEDIAFIIITIAVAISCATGKFLVGLLLVGFMFLYAVIRHKFTGRAIKQDYAVVTINTSKTGSVKNLEALFKQANVKGEFVSSRTYDGITSFVFSVFKAGQNEHDSIMEKLNAYDEKAQVSFFYPNERLGA